MNFRSVMTRALLLGSAALFAAACGEDQQQIPTETESPIQQVQAPAGDVATALAVKEGHGPDLMEIEGVVGHGLAMRGDNPVIRVYTLHGNVRGIPDHVENVPIERIVTGLIMAGDLNDPMSRERPAPNGFSIGHPDITAGTFGALVQDGGGTCYALSNNHVLANSNEANIGDSALQPGPFDGGSDPADAIGTLADFEPISFGSDNQMDAAIAVFFDAADAVGATPSGDAYGAPGTNPTSASVNQAVQKFGRTTGHTTGTVAETNATISVCYEPAGPFNCKSAATFVNQFTIEPGTFSDGGDSGSLIVTDDGSANPVGLLFAGSDTRTIANPIGPVLDRFNAVIQTDPSACDNHGGSGDTNSPPTASFTWSDDGLTVDFTDTSSDSDGSIASRSWDFGDGNTSTAQNPSHAYGADGTYTVTLTVADDDGATDETSQDVTVSADDPPADGITISLNAYKVRGQHTVDVSWSGASTNVDIHRDGTIIAPNEENDGFYTDNIGNRGPGSYTYQVCETGSTTDCSDPATATF